MAKVGTRTKINSNAVDRILNHQHYAPSTVTSNRSFSAYVNVRTSSEEKECVSEPEEVSRESLNSSDEVNSLHKQFVELYGEKEYLKALDSIERAIAKKPTYALLYYYRAIVLKSLGRYEETIKSMKLFDHLKHGQAAGREFDTVKFNVLAQSYYALGRLKEAVEAQTDFINILKEEKQTDVVDVKLASTLVNAFETRAQFFMLLKMFSRAHTDMSVSVDIQQQSMFCVQHQSWKLFHFFGFKAAFEDHNYKEALREIDSAIQSDIQIKQQMVLGPSKSPYFKTVLPIDFNLMIARVGVLQRLERFQDAIQALKEYQLMSQQHDRLLEANAAAASVMPKQNVPYADLIICKYLAELHKELGHYETALEYLTLIENQYNEDEHLPGTIWRGLVFKLKAQIELLRGNTAESARLAQQAQEYEQQNFGD